jgi:hypothetical protein
MMKREHTRAILRLSCDEQLVAGIGGAVAHFGERVGLRPDELGSLAEMLEEYCRRTLSLLEPQEDTLYVSIEDFEDRIEIVIEHRGQATGPVGESFAGAPLRQAAGWTAGVALLCTDRSETEYDSLQGVLRTRLVKYFPHGA